jgi:DNA-binding Xre family transcriptional regulator
MATTALMPVRFRLAELLREREKAGRPISQSELSRRSGVSLTTINGIVLNKTAQVSLRTLDALCDALDVGPGALFEREGKRKRGR